MKPSKDLPGLLQHHSPIKQVTNFYTDPCWERLRICRREHLGTKPCSFMPFIPKRASHSYNLFLKCAQECLIQKSLHLLPACQGDVFPKISASPCPSSSQVRCHLGAIFPPSSKPVLPTRASLLLYLPHIYTLLFHFSSYH